MSLGLAPLLRRILHYLNFAYEFVESAMISVTLRLNKLSKNYRYVSSCLAHEKTLLKVCQVTVFVVFQLNIISYRKMSRLMICRPAKICWVYEAHSDRGASQLLLPVSGYARIVKDVTFLYMFTQVVSEINPRTSYTEGRTSLAFCRIWGRPTLYSGR